MTPDIGKRFGGHTRRDTLFPNLHECESAKSRRCLDHRVRIYIQFGIPLLPLREIHMRFSGLDNLPNEVAHLLQEIREKEIKAQGNGDIIRLLLMY